ncbi:septum formation initiator family protein [Sphingomonas sp. HF-S3]|uniref:Septum formation initiator family protein n=1 Tax=Sphingomonas rustica TaxID=3103142 RepID=A0ABV0B8K9_9SPHN
MGRQTGRFRNILRSAGLPAVAIVIMAFFGYNAVLGPNGIIAMKDVSQEVGTRTAEYQQLDKKRAELRNRVNLLDPKKGADPDLVEELLRKQLGAARSDEVVVKLK